MSRPPLDTEDLGILKYIVTHVFCPLQLPDGNDHSILNDHSLASAITNAARLYSNLVDPANLPQWYTIPRMLENLLDISRSKRLSESRTISLINSMNTGDVLAVPLRAQNSGVIVRKQKDITIFESFELSPKAQNLMVAEGKIICSYPGPAIEIPNLVFYSEPFTSELVNFLAHMDHDYLDATAKERSSVSEDASHPRYITELLTGILRSVGRPADIPRIHKRIGDDVVCNDGSELPWRRSVLWLLIRITLQTTLNHSSPGAYKEFMLFFMCCLVKENTCAELPSDLLQFMAAKISRRLCKLDSSAPGWLSHIVLETCTSLRSTIDNRWTQAQENQCPTPAWNLSQLDLARDTLLSFQNSGDYLRNALTDHSIPPPANPFNPKQHPRGTLDDFLSTDGEFFKKAYRAEPHTTLYDVERAVEHGIDTWISQVTDSDTACVKLEILVDKYSSKASKAYANNPELLSVMLLTTIELWIALDKITVKEIPILADYSPEVPISLLENLLLCKSIKARRLRAAHEYLSCRHAQSHIGRSLFSSTITADSFVIRFYKKCSHLRHLKAQIERVARDEVHETFYELWEKNSRYSRQQGQQIRVHEWPLPADKFLSKAIVFELACPVSFDMWRAATFHLLVDLCSPSSLEGKTPRIKLNDYGPLAPYLVKHSRSRISLGSNSRRSPYLTLPIPAEEECISIKNGLTFFTFDTRTGLPVSQALGRFDSREHCTYKLQSGLYRNLQKYVDSSFHTSNEVIANQVDCHKDLSIHEYMAFGHLRSGGLLQWPNILRELRARSLNFRRPEVHMLFAQAVCQVGPLASVGWTWHQEIEQPTFCYSLLQELEALVRDVEGNWKEGVTMDTVSFLIRRLLASSPHEAISLEALNLLRAVRNKVFSWVQEISMELVSTPGRGEMRNVLRDTAAICRSTFDVDSTMIPNLLHSAHDIEVLLSCAVIIHDHMPSDVSKLPAYSQLLLDRDWRLSLALEGFISDIIQMDSTGQGINLAVRRMWPGYYPGSKWRSLRVPSSCWFSCRTAPPSDQCPQVIHLNILDGSLLVDGRLLGTWLPNKFMRHPLYKLIFGEKMLQVTPSDLPGMECCTRDLISDHRVYFSLIDDGSGLIIRMKRKQMVPGDSGIFELIPHEKLDGDLPVALIEGYTHWLNLSTSVMDIRPLDNIWKDSSANWKIDCTPGYSRSRKGCEYLIDIQSETWSTVSSLFRPLCAPQDLIVSVSPVDSSCPMSSLQLCVALPSYDLSFFVDQDGDLQSRSMRGMVYDENQSIGTLIGLVNRLVLRPKDKDVNAPGLIFRCVLIPDGDISFQMDRDYVRVEITPHRSGKKQVTYQTYKVNNDLGCLTGNTSLTSNLYRTYLHALTSGCGVDPLTGRTGTEEALSVLRSANCWSDARLGPRNTQLLNLIASLCPSRTWCSKGFAQKVEWHKLPANSQNHELFFLAKTIKEHYERLQVVDESPSSRSFKEFPLENNWHLLKRSARRAACLESFTSADQPSGGNLDALYPGKEVEEAGERRAHTAATHVYLKNAVNEGATDIWQIVASWKRNMSQDTTLSLRYNRRWLKPDLPSIWLQAYDLLRKSDDRKWFQMLFSLPAMAYSSPEHSKLVPVFVAFALHPEFYFEDPPHYQYYSIADGSHPRMDTLSSYVSACAYPLENSPEGMTAKKLGESDDKFRQRQLRTYNNRVQSDADEAAENFLSAWPCENAPRCSLHPHLYDVARLEFTLQRYFSSLFRNFKLEDHLTRVQTILNNVVHCVHRIPNTVPYSFLHTQNIPTRVPLRPSVGQLLARPAPLLPGLDRLSKDSTLDVGNTSLHDSAPLHQLIATVEANTANPFQRQYVSALRTSAESFTNETSLVYHPATKLPTATTLLEYYAKCRASCAELLIRIQQDLGPRSQSEQMLQLTGQWPRITAHTLFRLLASNSPITLPGDWKKCIITFTLHALELQRARRLVLLHLNDLREELWRELQNEGCDGWDAEAHPDWLLIQLQGNFFIRRVQAEVANEMISPRSSENTAMQLNMGEGKTSVIVPIVVAVLANGEQLVRVIVPKSLTTQTIHLLADRLSGLVNRRVFYFPFSRSLQLDRQKLASFRGIMMECMQERGILVVQPEHVLSFKLVSVEKQLSLEEDSQVAHLLLELQRWLHSYSRDILDESDELLDVRSQLVFTVGCQQHVEGSPERWTTTEQVLGLVSKHASSLRELFPLGVEYAPGPPGSFPHLRILQTGAGKVLTSWIAQDILDGHLPNVSLGHLHFHSGLKDALRSFISCEDPPLAEVQLVMQHFGKTSLWGGLLLLRGLLANDVLLSAVRERRWRVDYGLSRTRTMLAVPYRAKDVPAQRAEFGHPDIAIVLTYLSYYYSGLNREQLKVSFGILFKQHDPSIEYDLWLRVCPAVPTFLWTINCVNVESVEQWNKILFPMFSRNRATINFYLSNVVFPREAKEFPSKLSSSGWDLAEKKERVLTGFSGTNDGQYLLPLHITQRDPEHQRGTNAKVLSYLLRPENNYYMCVTPESGTQPTTRQFLEILVAQKPEIRVLLDVGAQILDCRNHQLARAWLDINPNASAAVYFNESDELTVRTRNGSPQRFLSSPYVEQLDRCVIYLDDAHTRGTDIKFPLGFRAAVTLGPKVTKDRLIQGMHRCMRMRKLGNGHSVLFLAPLAVHCHICSVAGKGSDASIDTTDVLHWTIRETWEYTQRWAPHWVQQGMDHACRFAAWSKFCRSQLTSQGLSDKWLQQEAKRLQDLYGPRDTLDIEFLKQISPEIHQRCIDLGVRSLWSVDMDEEQEREVVFEVIREYQAGRRPSRVPPARHSIHQDVVDFVKTGIIRTQTSFSGPRIRNFSSAFMPAFETLDATSAGSKEVFIWGQSVLVTADFERTVKGSGKMDDYLRPVHWIVSAKRASGDLFVILSPYEANALLPEIRSSNKVHLHLYTPRITKSMKPHEDLGLYSIPAVQIGWIPPSTLMDQLNVFAGQLFLKDYETYIRLCRFLCLYARDLKGIESIVVEPDGFILPKNRRQLMSSRPENGHTFASSPLVAIKSLMSVRGRGIDFSATHMGRIIHGRLLSEDDFDEQFVVTVTS